MSWTYNGTDALASAATGFFNARQRPCRVSPYILMSDPKRLPDLIGAVKDLPCGSTLIYRHFDMPDKQAMARQLRALTFERDIHFLIGQDEELARLSGADGLHLPERHLGRAKTLRTRYPDWIITSAAHSELALERAADAHLDAAILSPVFESKSPSADKALGVEQFSEWTRKAIIPVFALGGIGKENVSLLIGSGAAGIAGISGFVS